jgi:hypothetical protein
MALLLKLNMCAISQSQSDSLDNLANHAHFAKLAYILSISSTCDYLLHERTTN